MAASLRMLYGIARSVAGKAVDEYLHDVAYWHFRIESLKQLTDEQAKIIRELLEMLETYISNGRSRKGKVVIPWIRESQSCSPGG